jgi:hypothetical protein
MTFLHLLVSNEDWTLLRSEKEKVPFVYIEAMEASIQKACHTAD